MIDYISSFLGFLLSLAKVQMFDELISYSTKKVFISNEKNEIFNKKTRIGDKKVRNGEV